MFTCLPTFIGQDTENQLGTFARMWQLYMLCIIMLTVDSFLFQLQISITVSLPRQQLPCELPLASAVQVRSSERLVQAYQQTEDPLHALWPPSWYTRCLLFLF